MILCQQEVIIMAEQNIYNDALARGIPEKLAHRINGAVAACGLSRATLYKLHKEGKLRMVKVAGRTLILHRDLVSLLNGGMK